MNSKQSLAQAGRAKVSCSTNMQLVCLCVCEYESQLSSDKCCCADKTDITKTSFCVMPHLPHIIHTTTAGGVPQGQSSRQQQGTR